MRILFLVSLLSAVMIVACDAPRENPFDPGAGNYSGNQESVLYVGNLSNRAKAVVAAAVVEEYSRFYGISDISGQVRWTHASQDSFLFTIEKDGYFERQTVRLRSPDNFYEILLNARPSLQGTRFVSRYTSNRETYILSTTDVQDADGILDVTSVFLSQEELGGRADLMPAIGAGSNTFSREVNIKNISSSLNANNLTEYDFDLVVTNQNSDSARFGPYVIRRVIDQVPTPESPDLAQPEEGDILFNWSGIDADFDFHYRIELYNNSFDFLGGFTPISSDSSSFELADGDILDRLSPTGNFWVLFVVDDLGNTSQSRFIFFDYER